MYTVLVSVVLASIWQTQANPFSTFNVHDFCPVYTLKTEESDCLPGQLELDLSNYTDLESRIGEFVQGIKILDVEPGSPDFTASNPDCSTAVTVKAHFETFDKLSKYGCFYQPSCDNVQCRRRMLQIDLHIKTIQYEEPPRKGMFNIFNKYFPGASKIFTKVGSDGTILHLTCSGKRKIQILEATLTRNESSPECHDHTFPDSENVTEEISPICDGKSSCYIDVDKCIEGTSGSDCPVNNLTVTYKCTDPCDMSPAGCPHIFGFTEGAEIIGYNTDVNLVNSREQCCKKRGYTLLLPDILNIYHVQKVRIYVSHHYVRVLTDHGYDRTQCDDCLFNLNNKYDDQDGQNVYITLNHVLSHTFAESCEKYGYGILKAKFKWVSSLRDNAWSYFHYD